MTNDDEFLRSLRVRADAAVPAVTVDTAVVIPRARRRRAGRRIAATATAVVLLAATGWLAVELPRHAPDPQPAVTDTPSPTPAPTDSPTPPETTAPTPEPQQPTEAPTPADIQSLFWYQRVESSSGPSWFDETWIDRNGMVWGYYESGKPTAHSDDPVITQVLVDGALLTVNWTTVDGLPTDPGELTRAIEGGLRYGTNGDPNASEAEIRRRVAPTADLIMQSAVTRPELTRALIEVISGTPGASAPTPATDALGRVGTAVTYVDVIWGETWQYTVVADTASGGPLEWRSVSSARETFTTTVVESRPSDGPPYSPEDAGYLCGTWASCVAEGE